jgi:hypothetical protein
MPREGKAMSSFRRVEDAEAGPNALGILIPPSRRTFLILRPRSLTFDLLYLQAGEDTAFRELSHDEASAAAHQLYRAMHEWTPRVEVVANSDDSGKWLRVQVGPFYFAACGRVPGKPYQPLVFADADAVRETVMQLIAILCPLDGVEQELYFNTRHFQA